MAEDGDKIPTEFYSYDSGQPFESCIQCGIDLLNSGITYVVEKSVKRYPDLDHFDIIYEYAMCMNCMEK